MNKRKTGFVFIILFTMALGYLYPQNEINKKKPKDSQIEGELVDLTCYISRGLSGEGHKSCATRCLTRGAPAGEWEYICDYCTKPWLCFLRCTNHSSEWHCGRRQNQS